MKRTLAAVLVIFLTGSYFVVFEDAVAAVETKPFFNIRDYGAKGDGKGLDTGAINNAIEAAAATGGGTVYFPAGTYLSFSIRLKSNITIHLDNGATLLAADPAIHKGKYDMPEPNQWDMYQDLGIRIGRIR